MLSQWKEKVKFDIVNSDKLNWLEYLPEYQKLHNKSPHGLLRFLTPFEVFFGPPSNRLKTKCPLERKTISSIKKNYDISKILMNLPKRKGCVN